MTFGWTGLAVGPAQAAEGTVDRAAFGVSSTGLITVEPTPNCRETTDFGQCEKEVVGIDEPGLTTGIIGVRTTGTAAPLKADSEASIAEAAVSNAEGTQVFAAQTIKSTCTADENGLTGGTVLADADFFDQEPPEPFDGAEPPPNTVAVDNPALRIILNEQIVTDDGSQITVNAVRVVLLNPDTGETLQETILASTQCSFHAADAPPPAGTGFLEICKKADNSNGAVTGRFTFRFAGRSATIPVGACTNAIEVPAGRLVVREVRKEGIRMSDCRTEPVERLRLCDPAERKAVVRIVEGGIGQETILNITNKRFATGQELAPIKVCKIAGEGVAVGTDFRFSLDNKSVTVPAGPASQGGFCKIVRGFEQGSTVKVTEQARAGTRVSRIAVAPATREVSSSRADRTARVRTGGGITVVSFTNNRS